MIGQDKIYTIRLDRIKEEDFAHVGLHAQNIHKAIQVGAYYPNGFVITTNAFDNFLVANDIVADLNALLTKTSANSDIKAIEEVSKEIAEIFRATVLPSSIFQSIQEAYNALSISHNCTVEIFPSWIPDAYKYNGDVDSKYTFSNIGTLVDLEKKIIQSWQAIFDPNAIFERVQNNYDATLSIALVIQRMINPEVSGKAFSFNKITDDKEEIEINAVFGLQKGIAELELTPDRYIVSKKANRIIEKHTTAQEQMLVHTNTNDETPERKVDISPAWRLSQKMQDELIHDLAHLVALIEAKLERTVEVDWLFEAGRLYITHVKYSNRPHRNHLIALENKSPDKIEPEKVEQKTIDEYVQEVEREIENIQNSDFGVVDVPAENVHQDTMAMPIATPDIKYDNDIQEATDTDSQIQDPEINETTSELAVEPLWNNLKFMQKDDVEATVLEIILDAQNPYSSADLNSKNFSGIGGVGSQALREGFGQSDPGRILANPSQFMDYALEQVSQLMSQDLSRSLVYSLTSAADFASQIQRGFIELELDILKSLKHKYGCKHTSIVINGVSQVSDLREIRRLITIHGFKHTNTTKIYMEIDQIPAFLNINDYLDESIDGVILNFDAILSKLLGEKVDIESALNNEVFWGIIEKISQKIHAHQKSFILHLKTFENEEELIIKFMKLGITGITIPVEKFDNIRKRIVEMELKVLD